MATLKGTAGTDMLFGGFADDSLFGLGGNDNAFGNDGNDSVFGGTGNDLLFGGIGNDVLDGSDGNDVLNAGDGNDLLKGGAGLDRLLGGFGNDILAGGIGNDRLSGGGGTDRLVGEAGNDILTGNSGRDRYDAGAGNDFINLGSTNFAFIAGGAGIDVLRLTGSNQSLDLTKISNTATQGIEVVNLTGLGDNTLILNRNEVLNLSDTDNLRVRGDQGDTLILPPDFSLTGAKIVGGEIVRTFESGEATIVVDQQVGVRLTTSSGGTVSSGMDPMASSNGSGLFISFTFDSDGDGMNEFVIIGDFAKAGGTPSGAMSRNMEAGALPGTADETPIANAIFREDDPAPAGASPTESDIGGGEALQHLSPMAPPGVSEAEILTNFA